MSSKLKSFNSELDVLEPTAGIGNLILPIIQMNKQHRIYMCEIEPSTRKILEELCKEAPQLLTLYSQPDFLKFVNPIEYDLI
jgi:hypothetical protein